MRRFSLNPLHPANVRAALVLGVVFAAVYFTAWVASHVGSWVYWLFAIALWYWVAGYYEKQDAQRRDWIRRANRKRGG